MCRRQRTSFNNSSTFTSQRLFEIQKCIIGKSQDWVHIWLYLWFINQLCLLELCKQLMMTSVNIRRTLRNKNSIKDFLKNSKNNREMSRPLLGRHLCQKLESGQRLNWLPSRLNLESLLSVLILWDRIESSLLIKSASHWMPFTNSEDIGRNLKNKSSLLIVMR